MLKLFLICRKGEPEGQERPHSGDLLVVRNLKSYKDGEPVAGYNGRPAAAMIVKNLTSYAYPEV